MTQQNKKPLRFRYYSKDPMTLLPLYTIHNKKTKHTWSASAEEALLYCSRVYGFQDSYLVYDVNAITMTGISLLAIIYKARREQKAKNV